MVKHVSTIHNQDIVLTLHPDGRSSTGPTGSEPSETASTFIRETTNSCSQQSVSHFLLLEDVSLETPGARVRLSEADRKP